MKTTLKEGLCKLKTDTIKELNTQNIDFRDIVIKCAILSLFCFLSTVHYIFVLATIALAAIFILFEKSSRCVYYMIFLLPFLNILRRTNSDLYYSIALWCLVLLILGIKLFISFFIKKDKKINWFFTFATLALLIYITIIGPFDFTTHGAAYLTIVICYVLYYYLKDFSFKEVVFIFFLGATVASITGLFRPLFERAQNIIPFFEDSGGRFTGVSNDPNYYAGDMLMILAGFMILYSRKEVRNLFYIALFTTSAFAIMSLSKMVILVYAIMMVLFCVAVFFKHRWKPGFIKCLSFFICFLLSCAVCTKQISALTGRLTADDSNVKQEQLIEQPTPTPEDVPQVGETPDKEEEEEEEVEYVVYEFRNNPFTVISTGRTNIWIAYMEESFSSAKTILFGHGIGAPFILCDNGYRVAKFAEHNTFVQMMYRLGIVGIGLIALMVVAGAWKKKFKGATFTNFMNAIVMAGLFMSLCNLLSYRISIHILILILSLNYRGEPNDREIFTPSSPSEYKLSRINPRRLLSIIIPCHNVAPYIEKCLNSIIQNVGLEEKNYEIIVVNDASSDDTMSIVERVAKEHKNIFMFNSSARGVSVARNCGIANSLGEYVSFIDGDDVVNADYKKAVSLLKDNSNIDMYQFALVHENQGKTTVMNNFGPELCNRTYSKSDKEMKTILSKLSNSACQKFVRREVLSQNNILFKKYAVAEDMEWVVRVVLASKKIHVSDIAYYHYIRRVTSATATASLSKTLDAINACREAIGEIELSSAAPREKRWLKQFVTNTVYSTLQYYKKLDINDRKAFREEMYKNLDLMGYPSKPKFLLLKSCLIIFGIDTTLGIMLKI